MDYTKYVFSKKELVLNIGILITGMFIISKLFYGNFYTAIFLCPFIWIFTKIRRTQLKKKRFYMLRMQFKDAINAIADSMITGTSLENAIKESYKEMKIVYGECSYICTELREMISKININVPIENVFDSFAKRTGLEEIQLFAQILSISKRTGGNMVSITKLVSENLRQRFSIESDIRVNISAKLLEQRIMSLVPIGIIIYIETTSPGFLNIMYETISGKIIMSICLGVYGIACYWAEKILDIEI